MQGTISVDDLRNTNQSLKFIAEVWIFLVPTYLTLKVRTAFSAGY